MTHMQRRVHMRKAFIIATLQVLISIGYIILAITAPDTARAVEIIGLYVVSLLMNSYMFRKCFKNGRA